MDPKACLDDAESFADEGNLVESLALMAEYYDWRIRGGFDPGGCDERAKSIRKKIRSKLRAKN